MRSTERGIRTYRQTGEQPEKQRKAKNKKTKCQRKRKMGKTRKKDKC